MTRCIVTLLLLVCIAVVLSACGKEEEYESSLPGHEIQSVGDGLLAYTDNGTGCQYLSRASSSTGLTPRLDASGKHICK